MTSIAMNLLFVYPHAILPHRGGTERVAYTVANALRACGHQVWFMATKSGEADAYLAENPDYILIDETFSPENRKQTVIRICAQLKIDAIINEGGEFEDFAIFSNEVLPGVKIITCLHFDVYGEIKYFRREEHFHNLTTSRIKRFFIEAMTCIGIDPYRIKFYLAKRRQFRQMLQVSDAVVVVTPIIAQQLKQITGTNSPKIVSILNPVPFADLLPVYDDSAKEKSLLYVGRFSPDKNVDKILQAWAHLAPQYPDWKLEIAGDGEMRNALHNLAQQMQIPRVQFHGQIQDVRPLYNRAEYVLLASDCESFSCVVMEGFLHGCYPIVFDYPSAPVVIPDAGIGTIVKYHRVSALAKAISKALDRGHTNRHNLPILEKHLNRFSMYKLAPTWEKLLQKLCSTSVSPET